MKEKPTHKIAKSKASGRPKRPMTVVVKKETLDGRKATLGIAWDSCRSPSHHPRTTIPDGDGAKRWLRTGLRRPLLASCVTRPKASTGGMR
jgi:hypothetical protein